MPGRNTPLSPGNIRPLGAPSRHGLADWQGDCTPDPAMARSWRERTVGRAAGATLVALAAFAVGGCATPNHRAGELSAPAPVILAQGSSWELIFPAPGGSPGPEASRNAQALGYGRPTPASALRTDTAPRVEDRRYIVLPRSPDRVLIFPPQRGRR